MIERDIDRYKKYAIGLVQQLSGAYTDESLARLLVSDSNSDIGKNGELKTF